MTLKLSGLMANWIGLLGLLVAHASLAQSPAPAVPALQNGVLPDHWQSGGPKCMEMPEWQVHEYNPQFFILRQSGCTDFEKPFVFLLFGNDRALLLDTGSRNGNLGPTLQRTVHAWLARNARARMPLTVVHTHGHDDHIAGDAGLLALNDPLIPITLIKAEVEAERTLFGIAHWPQDLGSIDLGGRLVDIIPIPGHSDTSVAFYDRLTAVLFAGDSLYPGRLYIHDFPAFQASTERLVRFTADKPIAHILGNHIEQTRTPYLDYPTGTLYQPDEHELALSRGALLELALALDALHGKPARVALRDFTLFPSPTTDAERATLNKAFEETQRRQLKSRWDQTAP